MSTVLNVDGIGRVSPWFLWRLVQWCDQVGLSADCLLAIMSLESGMKASIQYVNPKTGKKGAAGLIQVIPSQAKNFGYASTADIAAASAEEQLERIVFKQFGRWAKKLQSSEDCGDYYMTNFLPAAVGMADDTVLGRAGDSGVPFTNGPTYDAIYQGNWGFDPEAQKPPRGPRSDGSFTVGNVKALIRGRIINAQKRPRVTVPDKEPSKPGGSKRGDFWLNAGLFTGAVLAGAWAAKKALS